MNVYKFGGASVRNAEGIRNLAAIVSAAEGRIFVVVSAMGKMTNALEGVLEMFYTGHRDDALARVVAVQDYHDGIIADLWGRDTFDSESGTASARSGKSGAAPHGDSNSGAESGNQPSCAYDGRVRELYAQLEKTICNEDPTAREYEYWYDLIVSYGELISTTIISEYLNHAGVKNLWVDMRRYFVTNHRHRDANIDIEASSEKLVTLVGSSPQRIFIGQGFIGATPEGETTTIGREGSDYSAAVVGHILDAESVTIWKDVEGILNGDPKIFAGTRFIPEMTYLDAIELAFSGAQVIHPKTIKPLQNKRIPLHVRCFMEPAGKGSVIKEQAAPINMPILILKRNQTLLTIRPYDFSFVLEERFAQIFGLLGEYNVKVNLIQNSALSLSLCMDATRYLPEIIDGLRKYGFHAVYNTDMELLTIRGFTPAELAQYAEGDDVYLSQRTRRNIRIVRRPVNRE